MADRRARLAHLALSLEQARNATQADLSRSLSRIAQLHAERTELEAIAARDTKFADLAIAGLVTRLARIAVQSAQEERVSATLREKAVQYEIKNRLVKARIAAASTVEAQMTARRELDELAGRTAEASLRQAR